MKLRSFLNLKQIGITEDDCSDLSFTVIYFFLFMYLIIVPIHEIHSFHLHCFHCICTFHVYEIYMNIHKY